MWDLFAVAVTSSALTLVASRVVTTMARREVRIPLELPARQLAMTDTNSAAASKASIPDADALRLDGFRQLREIQEVAGDQVRFVALMTELADSADAEVPDVLHRVRALRAEMDVALRERHAVLARQQHIAQIASAWSGRPARDTQRPAQVSDDLYAVFFGS